MSVLIKGMKMPKCCEICPFNYDYFRCNALGEKFDDKEEINFEMQRLSDCPLVEIPPHGNLIDKDKLVNALFDLLDDSDKPVHDMLLEVETAPTVIESEEQDHGDNIKNT